MTSKKASQSTGDLREWIDALRPQLLDDHWFPPGVPETISLRSDQLRELIRRFDTAQNRRDERDKRLATETGYRLESIKTKAIQSHGNWGGDKDFAVGFLGDLIKDIKIWQAELRNTSSTKTEEDGANS